MDDCLDAEVFTWVCGTGIICHGILGLALCAIFTAFFFFPPVSLTFLVSLSLKVEDSK